MKKRPVPFKGRPTEFGAGAAAALAFLIALIFHLSQDVTLALIVVLGAIPGAITWAVELWRKSGNG